MTETLTATLTTTQGTVTVRLFPDHAPKTVRNFVELAEGGREWTDPQTGHKRMSIIESDQAWTAEFAPGNGQGNGRWHTIIGRGAMEHDPVGQHR